VVSTLRSANRRGRGLSGGAGWASVTDDQRSSRSILLMDSVEVINVPVES
jgi:hypothetical protein